jgi:hypothetical protein
MGATIPLAALATHCGGATGRSYLCTHRYCPCTFCRRCADDGLIYLLSASSLPQIILSMGIPSEIRLRKDPHCLSRQGSAEDTACPGKAVQKHCLAKCAASASCTACPGRQGSVESTSGRMCRQCIMHDGLSRQGSVGSTNGQMSVHASCLSMHDVVRRRWQAALRMIMPYCSG